MLRQGAPAPEFADPDALRAHYRALHARTWAPREVRPTPEAARAAALAEARRAYEEARAAEREAEALADRERVRALAAQVLTPVQLAREPKRIIAHTAEAFGFTYADILGPRQLAPLVRARWAAIAAVREARPDISTTQLGRVFNRDHTTILHAFRQIERLGVPQPPAGGEAP